MAHVSFDLASLKKKEAKRAAAAAAAPKHPLLCFYCKKPFTAFAHRKYDNGHAGRPFDKCLHCGKFFYLAYERRTPFDNPCCDCGVTSKIQVSCDRKISIGSHYACRLGVCNYYEPCFEEVKEKSAKATAADGTEPANGLSELCISQESC